MENNFFPVFINLKGKRCLVIGAGNIAYRKIKTLMKYGAEVTVITREIAEEKISELQGLNMVIRDFMTEDLENVFLVVAATDNIEFNKHIFQLCEEKNILVNNMTSKIDMNIRFAAIYEDESVQIAVSAKGYPKKSLEIRNRIKDMFEECKK